MPIILEYYGNIYTVVLVICTLTEKLKHSIEKHFFEHCVLTHAIQSLVSYFKPKYRSCATFCVLAMYADCMVLQQQQPKS